MDLMTLFSLRLVLKKVSLNPYENIRISGFNDTFFKTRRKEKTTKLGKLANVIIEKGIYKSAIYRSLDKVIKKFKPNKKFEQNLDPSVRPKEFRDNLTLEESTKLAIKCLAKALEERQLSPRIKIAVIPKKTGKIEMLSDQKVENYLKELGLSK